MQNERSSLRVCWGLDIFGLVRRDCEIFSRNLFVNRKGKKQKRLILDTRFVNWAFVSPPGVSLCSSEGMARIEVCLPNHVDDESPTWESALESIELSLGVGDILDCFHRYISDGEFASYFGVDTVFASELSLSGSCLDGVLLVDHSEVDLLPFLRTNDQRKDHVEKSGSRGIPHHE